MFRRLTLTGRSGSIVWGYRSVATLVQWTVRRTREDEKHPWQWELEARLSPGIDQFCLRQRPLLFTAPRHKGMFCWPVQELTITAEATRLTARLGPPEY